jgi:tRNA uridine 5-carboxymethylaminomethyl modification enzyme
MHRYFDLIVIGGGHAGSEAAHASAKLGLNTLLLTSSIDQIASMPCNPAIGGPAKSHLVKEIDALGGLMGLAADATYIQMKTLNSSKGPAVRALRAQSDKKQYSAWVRQYLEKLPNLTIYQSSATALIFSEEENSEPRFRVIGIQTNLDERIFAGAVVLTAGTFLEGRTFTGDKFQSAGRAGEKASIGLSANIRELGLRTGRLKTGTPPRVDRDTIDFSQLEIAPGDDELSFFSFLPNRPARKQYPCHITRTNADTHKIILDNLHKSPMYSGLVAASGPRYCPSIEDKVVRFPHNPSHHFFLEPEGLDTKEIYLQGCSTSLPVDVQWQMLRTLPGCEQAVITRPAYAVEYDYFPSIQFKHNFEAKNISGFFAAGQVLGTSGYEEAAAQGIVAGINAAIYSANKIKQSEFSQLVLEILAKNYSNQKEFLRNYVADKLSKINSSLLEYTKDKDSLIFDRSSSYIGTLVDDLVTKEINDPYRMLTSRSEYRLILRQDNADQRLTPLGRQIGLVDDYRWEYFELKQKRIQQELAYLNQVRLNQGEGRFALLADLLKQQDYDYHSINNLINSANAELTEKERNKLESKSQLIKSLLYGFEVETIIKYEGYIARQIQQIEQMDKYEKISIPKNFDFKNCQHISLEARDKLSKVEPRTLGQASRVGGVSANDLSVLSVMLENRRRMAV